MVSIGILRCNEHVVVGPFEHPLAAARMKRHSCEQRSVRGRADIDILGAMQREDGRGNLTEKRRRIE